MATQAVQIVNKAGRKVVAVYDIETHENAACCGDIGEVAIMVAVAKSGVHLLLFARRNSKRAGAAIPSGCSRMARFFAIKPLMSPTVYSSKTSIVAYISPSYLRSSMHNVLFPRAGAPAH